MPSRSEVGAGQIPRAPRAMMSGGGEQIPRGPRATMGNGRHHISGVDLRQQPQCLTCTQLGHEYTQCTSRCANCPERAYHDGRRCPVGEALEIYPARIATQGMKADALQTLNSVLQEWSVAVAERKARLEELRWFESEFDKKRSHKQTNEDQVAEYSPLTARQDELQLASAADLLAQSPATTTGIEHLWGWTPAIIQSRPYFAVTPSKIVAKKQRRNQKNKEWRKRKKERDRAESLQLGPLQQDNFTDGVESAETSEEKFDVPIVPAADATLGPQRSEMGGLPTNVTATHVFDGVAQQPAVAVEKGECIEQVGDEFFEPRDLEYRKQSLLYLLRSL